VDWSKYIDTVVAVERGDPYCPERKQSLLLSNAIDLGLIDRLTLLRGEMNRIIMYERDIYNQRLRYPFELVNFDYGGSILYPDRMRVEALEKFIRNQRGANFLLLLTLNTREFDSEEINQTQARILAEIAQVAPHQAENVERRIKRANASPHPFMQVVRQVMHVLYMVRGFAEANRYRVWWELPLVYRGSRKTILVHYLFDLHHDPKASTKVVSPQGVMDIVRASVRILKGQRIRSVALLDSSTSDPFIRYLYG